MSGLPPIKATRRAAVEYLRSVGVLPTSGHAAATTALWRRPAHQAKISETNRQRVADPEKLTAMRMRLERNRMKTRERMSESISAAYFAKHGWGGFATNQELTDWIVEQYSQGESTRQIGLALRMAHNSVVDRLRRNGIEPAGRGRERAKLAASRRHLADKGYDDMAAFDAEIAALYQGGVSANALRNLYGVGAQAIRTSLYRSNVPLRGKAGEPSKISRWRR